MRISDWSSDVCSSDLARLTTIAAAAAAAGRRVALVGRSLLRMNEVARETGYMKDTPAFLSEEHVGFLPRDEVVLICTGSQGDRKSVVTGKSVSVRVDSGGRRSIKKNKSEKQ